MPPASGGAAVLLRNAEIALQDFGSLETDAAAGRDSLAEKLGEFQIKGKKCREGYQHAGKSGYLVGSPAKLLEAERAVGKVEKG